MPLHPQQQAIIHDILDGFFPEDAEALSAFPALCQQLAMEALSLTPGTHTRARHADESSDHYNLFACIAYPEMQFKRLEKQQAQPITVAEVQLHVVLYLVARLLHQQQSSDTDFQLETWQAQWQADLARHSESKTETPQTDCEWLQHPHLQQQAETRLSWPLAETLTAWQTQRSHRCQANQPEPSFQTYTPEQPNWDLTQDLLRNYKVVIIERESPANAEEKQLDLTITLEWPTSTVTYARDNFIPYSAAVLAQDHIKRRALTIARHYAREKTFHYLNRMLQANLTFDKTLHGLWLLTYRHYVKAVLQGQLDLGFFFTLTGADRIQLSHSAVMTLHEHAVTDIETLRTLPEHVLQLFEISIYLAEACISPQAFAKLAALSLQQTSRLRHPAVINLQKLGKLSLPLALEITAETIAIYADDFYFEAIRDDKIAAEHYHPTTREHKDFALNPRVKALIKAGRIVLEKTHNLTIHHVRLINHPFYHYLLLQGHLDFKTLSPWLDDIGTDYLRTWRGMREILTPLSDTLPTAEYRLLQALSHFAILHYTIDRNATINPQAPGMKVLASDAYFQMMAVGQLTTAEILRLSPRGADNALDPAIIPLVKNGCLNIEYVNHLSALDIYLVSIPHYQTQLLNQQIDMIRLLAQSRVTKAALALPVIIQLQAKHWLTFTEACDLHTRTIDVLANPAYSKGVLSGQFPLSELRSISASEHRHLQNPVIQSLVNVGVISLAAAKRPAQTGYHLLQILRNLLLDPSAAYSTSLLATPEQWTLTSVTEFYYKLHLLNIHATLTRHLLSEPALKTLPVIKLLMTWIEQTKKLGESDPQPTLWTDTFHYLATAIKKQPNPTPLTFFAPKKPAAEQTLQANFNTLTQALDKLLIKMRPQLQDIAKDSTRALRIP